MFQQKCRIVYHVTAPLSPNDLPILGRPPSERLDPPILGFLFQDQLIWVLIQSWLTGVWPASKCSPILQTGFCFDFHHADTITNVSFISGKWSRLEFFGKKSHRERVPVPFWPFHLPNPTNPCFLKSFKSKRFWIVSSGTYSWFSRLDPTNWFLFQNTIHPLLLVMLVQSKQGPERGVA